MNSYLHNNGIKGLIFDYGGTLDTGGCHWGRVLWRIWQQAGIPVDEAAFREAYVYTERMLGSHRIVKSDFTFRQTLEEKLRLELTHVGCPDYLSQVLEMTYAETLRHTAHSREVLEVLAQDFPLVLVSNFYGNMPVVLQEFGLQSLFRHVVESAVVGVRKPDPRIFSLGVEALELLPNEVAVVGDSIEKDIIPARKAGCKAIWMKGLQWTDAPVDEQIPDLVITDLKELL